MEISEIMYNPSVEQGKDAYNEWVILHNTLNQAVNVSGWTLGGDRIIGDSEHGNGSTTIPPHGYAIVTDLNTRVYEHFMVRAEFVRLQVDDEAITPYGLNNNGDTIVLKNRDGNVVDDAEYSPAWGGNGNGKTLVKENGTWVESEKVGGSLWSLDCLQDPDGDGLNDGDEVYTKVYEYPMREYASGGTHWYSLKWKEESYSKGVKEAKVIVGVRADKGSSISVAIYYGSTLLNSATTNGVAYISASLMKYVGKSVRYVKVKINGKGWLESFKVILVEKSDPHEKDTDKDGLSDGYEIKGLGGYKTSPVSKDTDGDGISDKLEMNGWMWDYCTKKIHEDSNGFHTNPLSKDTDGDGYNDNEDANPLANLMLRMSLEEYKYYDHPDYTKFAGLWTKWELNGQSNDVVYYTEHKDHTSNLCGYIYWFDVPDDIDTEMHIKAGAFYNDWGDKKLGEWNGSFSIKSGYSYWISKSNSHYVFKARFWVYPLGRVHTIAVYNDTVWNDGKYEYSGKYYVLYVNSAENDGVINKGLNVIIVPDVIFVNSRLYEKIKGGDVSYLRGSDGEDARMGAIAKKSMGVHIVGMFFFNAT